MLKFAAVVNILLGAVFAIVAAVGYLAAAPSNSLQAIGLGVGFGAAAIACLGVGIFLLLRGPRTLGADPLLQTGSPATAMINSVRETGITLQFGALAVLEFVLEINPGTPSAYVVSCRSTVPRVAFSMIGIGKLVKVRVDPQKPHHVAIDWYSGPPNMTQSDPHAAQ